MFESVSLGKFYNMFYMLCTTFAFTEKPTFTQIAEWRKVLARLVQFLRLVDMQVSNHNADTAHLL